MGDRLQDNKSKLCHLSATPKRHSIVCHVEAPMSHWAVWGGLPPQTATHSTLPLAVMHSKFVQALTEMFLARRAFPESVPKRAWGDSAI